MAWFYLFIASIFEIAWTFSLRFLSVKKLKSVEWRGFFTHPSAWAAIWPFAGYIVFGLGNVIFFSMAMKEIPPSTALAVWMGAALVGVKLVEVFFLKGETNVWQVVYMGLILVGIVGLKGQAS